MKSRTLVLVGIVVAAAVARLLPHPPNFTPIDALALFAAAHFRSRILALATPLLAMLLGDLGLALLHRLGLTTGWMAAGQGFHSGMGIVYLAVALVGCLGLLLRRWRSLPALAACTLGGAILFFLVTNFVWWPGYMLYPQTLAGLRASYLAALPFFHWTLLGDLFYVTVFFGGFVLVQLRYPAMRTQTVSG